MFWWERMFGLLGICCQQPIKQKNKNVFHSPVLCVVFAIMRHKIYIYAFSTLQQSKLFLKLWINSTLTKMKSAHSVTLIWISQLKYIFGNTLYLSPFLAIFKATAGLKNFLKHTPCVTFLMALQRTRHWNRSFISPINISHKKNY